ncbi:MAG: hypothetical protein C0404_14550 [Verrucomicrobia bacterium]|nr:hypothetical protein [Verrucomicrobiota bacterium]
MRWNTARTLIAGLCLTGLLAAAQAVAQDDDPMIGEKPLSELLKQLKSENRGIQVRAAKVLADAPAEVRPKMMPKMMVLLKSERENDKFVAAQVLGECGPAAKAAIPDLLPMLKGTQYERNRAAAAKALGQILKDAQPAKDVDEVIDALISKISDDYDSYSDVRREVAQALGMIGTTAKKCIPKMTQVLTQGSHGLGSTQDQEYRLVRRAAAWTCSRMGPLAKEHMDLLISRMHMEGESCPEVVVAIGAIGPVQANVIPNIIDKIESSGRGGDAGSLKVPAFAALAGFGEKSAAVVPLIRRALQGPMWGNDAMPIRIAMMKALPAFGAASKEAAPEILAQIRLGKSQGDELSKTLAEEATKAYKAVTGQDPPTGK